MKGYNTVGECVNDYALLHAAKKMPELRKKKGETLISYLEKSIRLKMANSSKKFRQATKKYTKEDFQLMAIDSVMKNVDDLRDFLKQWNRRMGNNAKIKRILKSSAFKNGDLRLIDDYLPRKISSSKDLIEFISEYDDVTTSCIKAVSDFYKIRNWQRILRKAEEDKLIRKGLKYWGP